MSRSYVRSSRAVLACWREANTEYGVLSRVQVIRGHGRNVRECFLIGNFYGAYWNRHGKSRGDGLVAAGSQTRLGKRVCCVYPRGRIASSRAISKGPSTPVVVVAQGGVQFGKDLGVKRLRERHTQHTRAPRTHARTHVPFSFFFLSSRPFLSLFSSSFLFSRFFSFVCFLSDGIPDANARDTP